MLFSAVSLAIAGLVASVSAQSSTGAYSYTISANDPKATPAAVNQWCLAQTQTCRQICGGTAPMDTCDSTTLSYTCTCPDGTKPDMTQYNQTLPYFECQIYQQNCIAANPTDAQAQQSCNAIPCGGKAPTELAVSSSSSSTPTSSGMSSSGGSASATAASSSAAASGAASPIRTGSESYMAIGALVAGLMLLGGVAL